MLKLRALLAATALAIVAPTIAFASQGDGYPSRGKAIEALSPASDYSDKLQGRPLALGIMRTRGQGFVPSPELQAYVNGVMMRLLRGVTLPASFHPEVHVLAAPEFAGECTPDGTLIITIGLLEQLETEDELAFVLGHELAHAIYRHEAPDWYRKSQYYAVVNGVAVDTVAQGAALSLGGSLGGNIGRGVDVAQHLAKLSANVLMPQMERGQEDAADALGFDLMVKAGYDPEAPLAVMDKLAEQEAEAARAAQQAKYAAKNDRGLSSDDDSGGLFGKITNVAGGLGSILAGGRPSNEQIADIAIFAFDSAVDNMAEDATTHHPAKEREDLLSAYEFREYRTIMPTQPTPLPWAPQSNSPLKPQLTAMLGHYTDAENAAAYIADSNQGTAAKAQADVARATGNPTTNHAYTQFVAAEYYEGSGQAPLSEAALNKAVQGPEPSWEVYSRLTDIYIAKQQYPKAQALMDQAVTRFDHSPVLYPKRIQVYRLEGQNEQANALVPQCKAAKIDELYDACKKANGES